jgi:hypothetical protein
VSMQQDEEYDGKHDKNRRRRKRNTEEHSERAGKRKAREKQHGARKKAKGTNETNAPLGAHPPPGRGGGRGRCGGGSGGQGRVQGRKHSDVSTARLPVSTRTLRGCLIGEGQLNKDISPPVCVCAAGLALGCCTRGPGLPRGVGDLSKARKKAPASGTPVLFPFATSPLPALRHFPAPPKMSGKARE